MDREKVKLWLVGSGIGIIGIAIAVGAWQEYRSDWFKYRLREQDQAIELLRSERDTLWKERDQLAASLEASTKKLAEKKVVYVSKPIPPLPPLPSTDADLSGDLERLGLSQVVIKSEIGNVMYRPDALTVREWGLKTHTILPAVEAKLKAADEVIVQADVLIADANKVMKNQAKDIELANEEIARQNIKITVTNKALENERRQAWKRWGYGIAGVGLGYLLGR